MKYFYSFILLINYLLYILIDYCVWIKYGSAAGKVWILPLFLFPIAVRIAHHFAISKADEFFLSEWDVFKKKLSWGNTVAITPCLILMRMMYA